MIVHDTLFIVGAWVEPTGTSVIDVICPATEQTLGRVPDGTSGDIDRAVDAARR